MKEEKHTIKDICPKCSGQGYTAEHAQDMSCNADEHLDCPIQVQCEECEATGRILFTEVGKII